MMQSTLMQSVALSDSYSVEIDSEGTSDFVIVDASVSLDDDFDDGSYDDCDLKLSNHEHLTESHLEQVDASDDSSLLELQSLNNDVDLTIEKMLDEAHAAAKLLTVCDVNYQVNKEENKQQQQHTEEEICSSQNCSAPIQQEIKEDSSLSEVDKSVEEKSSVDSASPSDETTEKEASEKEVSEKDDSEVKTSSGQGNILTATFSRLSNKKRRKKAKMQKKMAAAAAARASLEEKTPLATKPSSPSRATSSSRTKGLTRYNKKRVANVAVSCAKESLVAYENEMKQSNKIR